MAPFGGVQFGDSRKSGNLVGGLTIQILIVFMGSMWGPPDCDNFHNDKFISLRVVQLISRLMYLQVVSGLESLALTVSS